MSEARARGLPSAPSRGAFESTVRRDHELARFCVGGRGAASCLSICVYRAFAVRQFAGTDICSMHPSRTRRNPGS